VKKNYDIVMRSDIAATENAAVSTYITLRYLTAWHCHNFYRAAWNAHAV